MSKGLSEAQWKTLERIEAAGYLYEGQLNGIVVDQLSRAGLIETTHDPGSWNWMLTADGRAALASRLKED